MERLCTSYTAYIYQVRIVYARLKFFILLISKNVVTLLILLSENEKKNEIKMSFVSSTTYLHNVTRRQNRIFDEQEKCNAFFYDLKGLPSQSPE